MLSSLITLYPAKRTSPIIVILIKASLVNITTTVTHDTHITTTSISSDTLFYTQTHHISSSLSSPSPPRCLDLNQDKHHRHHKHQPHKHQSASTPSQTPSSPTSSPYGPSSTSPSPSSPQPPGSPPAPASSPAPAKTPPTAKATAATSPAGASTSSSQPAHPSAPSRPPSWPSRPSYGRNLPRSIPSGSFGASSSR